MTERGNPSWDDPALADPSDSYRRARYRRKQSWYREVVLGAAPGRDAEGRLRGNLLAAEDVADRPGLAFLHDTGDHVARRLAEIPEPRPAVDVHDLHHDLLSPVGLTFNLLAPLCDYLRPAARILRHAFRLDVGHVERIDVDPHPPAGESGWLDALVVYTTTAGRLGFVGIVARYADAPARLDPGVAREHHGAERLATEALDVLVDADALDLWPAALEVAVLAERSGAVAGHVAVLATSDDAPTWAAVEALRDEPGIGRVVKGASYDEVLDSVVQRDGLSAWADGFAARYLDLTVVEGTSPG